MCFWRLSCFAEKDVWEYSWLTVPPYTLYAYLHPENNFFSNIRAAPLQDTWEICPLTALENDW